MSKKLIYFVFLCANFISTLAYANNILLSGESLLVNQSLNLEGDGIEWDQAVFSVNEYSLQLYVKNGEKKEIIWSTGDIIPPWEKSRIKIKSLDMILDGQLNITGNFEGSTSIHLGSYPKFPVKPIPGSYLIIEESISEKFRIALYSPMNELLWASDSNFEDASYILYPSYGAFFGNYQPGTILSLEGDGTGFDKAILEFDGNQLFLFEYHGNTKLLIWSSHPQTCGWGCKGKLGLHMLGSLYTFGCHNGSYFYGYPSSYLFIDKDLTGKARLALYSHDHGVYWTSEMNRMNADNMLGHWD